MTISSSTTKEFSIDQIVTLAHKLAGLADPRQNVDAARKSFARDLLELELDYVQTHGLFARSISFTELALTADTFKYNMGADVLDVIGDGAYIPEGEDVSKAAGETVVRPIDRDDWQALSAKDAKGRPYLYYPHRAGALVELRFWPVPDEAGTVRLQTHRLLADTQDGAATMDMRRYWVKYFTWKLAYALAEAASLSPEKRMPLKAEAEQCFRYAKNYANERNGQQARIDHPTGWR